MPTSRFLSSLLLSASLLLGAACSSTTTTARTPSDAGITPVTVTVTSKKASIDRAKLRDVLAARREQSVSRFLAYRDAGVYPMNDYTPGLQHVWIDGMGNLCAAATLISHDWGRAATAQVAAENNFIKLADVGDGPLL